MRVERTAVPDAYRITPYRHTDERGAFLEAFRHDVIADAVGRSFDVAQMNLSVSRRGTLRGLHGVALPPGQAKIVSCLRGAVRDVVVDTRVGSPTFGVSTVTVLDAGSGRSVFVAEGLAHGFLALCDDACVGYLCSTPYRATSPWSVDPFDADLDLPWGVTGTPLISATDAAAPPLAEASRSGLLADYRECLELYASLRPAGRDADGASLVQDPDRPGPAGAGAGDPDREAGDPETGRGQ